MKARTEPNNTAVIPSEAAGAPEAAAPREGELVRLVRESITALENLADVLRLCERDRLADRASEHAQKVRRALAEALPEPPAFNPFN